MDKKLFLASILLIFSFVFTKGENFHRKIPADIQKQIDDFVNEVYIPEGKIQGQVLGIMKNDGELVYSTGYGMADIARQLPNGNDTQFGLGSISKGITALIVVKTLQKHFPLMGESVLDTPVAVLALKLNLTFGDRYRTEQVTVRDLLSHRVCSGLNFLSTVAGAVPTTEEVLYRQRYEEETCKFRSNFKYTNQMITVAGEVAAAVAKKPFEVLVQELFDTLGMTRSTYVKITDDISKMNGTRAVPYYMEEDGKLHLYNPELLTKIVPQIAAGGLISTPNDMMRYLTFLLQKGKLNGRQIVPKFAINWIFQFTNKYQAAPVFKEEDEEKVISYGNYGLAWILGNYDGWQHFSHGGGLLPYASLVSIFPAQNLVIFSSAHEALEKVDKMVLHIFIFELLKGNPNAKEAALKYLTQTEQKQGIDNKHLLELGDPHSMENQKFLEEIKKYVELKPAAAAAAPPLGLYGSGTNGNLHLSEKFNPKINKTAYYVQYGRFHSGFLEPDSRIPGYLYKLNVDTDAMQEFYNFSFYKAQLYVMIWPNVGQTPNLSLFLSEDGLQFVIMYGLFVHGESLETLPQIPWKPGTCASG